MYLLWFLLVHTGNDIQLSSSWLLLKFSLQFRYSDGKMLDYMWAATFTPGVENELQQKKSVQMEANGHGFAEATLNRLSNVGTS